MFWGVVVWGEKDARGVVETPFCREDSICAGGVETPLRVAGVEDISVCKDDGVWGKVVAEVSDGLPVRETRVVAFLLPGAPVDGEDAGAAGQHHFCVGEGFLLVGEDANLCRDRHGECG